ncbi:MAG: Rrf2 family transcriptional regulator [Actinobacteria bacterium]|nr:Rrf2 family transcriptional regulator [Actinomycetota bacterium]
MWITRRTDYAARALLALCVARPDEVLNVDDIARRTAVPASVTKQIMNQMRSAGLVRSERGPSGGYRLNHRPDEITLERVVRLFQGPLAPIGCATRLEPEECPMSPGCSMQDVWAEVRDATIAILSRTTFADLAARAAGPWLTGVPLQVRSAHAFALQGLDD